MTPENREETTTLAEYMLLGEVYAAIVDATDDPARISEGTRLSLRHIDHALGVTLDDREDGSARPDSVRQRFYHAAAEDARPQRRRTDRVEAWDGCR